MLDTGCRWLDAKMVGREWAAHSVSLADCAAAPALFYADWTHAISEAFEHMPVGGGGSRGLPLRAPWMRRSRIVHSFRSAHLIAIERREEGPLATP